MADIDVVPKKGTNVWLWIIAALVVLAILWAVLASGRSDTGQTTGQLLDSGPVGIPLTETAA